jgi:hypothetical protein
METQEPQQELTMAERYPMTISIQLYDAWQLMRRYGDPGKICKEYSISRPIVDRALNYGNVKEDRVEKKITEFFNERFDRENNKGNKLLKKVKNQ